MRKSTILTAILIVFIFISPVYAQEDKVGVSRITPASPLYFLKSVREILEWKFAGTTHVKALRKLEFATRRIREVKSLVKTSRQDLIEPTLERYWWHLEEFKKSVALKDENMVGQVSEETTAHMSALQTVYKQISDQRALMSVRTTINKLSEWDQWLIDQLNLLHQTSLVQKITAAKLLGCNFLAREASSSALNEIERVVLLERAQKCLNTKP